MRAVDWINAVRQSVTPPGDPATSTQTPGEQPLWKTPTGLASDGLPSGWGPGYKFSSVTGAFTGGLVGAGLASAGVASEPWYDGLAPGTTSWAEYLPGFVGGGMLLGGVGGALAERAHRNAIITSAGRAHLSHMFGGAKQAVALPRVLGHAAGGAALGGGVGAMMGDDVSAKRVGVGALLGGLGGGAVGALRGAPKGPALKTTTPHRTPRSAPHVPDDGSSTHVHSVGWDDVPEDVQARAREMGHEVPTNGHVAPVSRTPVDLTHPDTIEYAHAYAERKHLGQTMDQLMKRYNERTARNAAGKIEFVYDDGFEEASSPVLARYEHAQARINELEARLPHSGDHIFQALRAHYPDVENPFAVHTDLHRPQWRDQHYSHLKAGAFGAQIGKTLQSAASALKPLATSVSNKIKPALGTTTQSAMGASSGAKPISPWTVGGLGTTGTLTALHPFSPTKRAALDPGEADDLAAAFGGRIPAGMEHLYGAQDAAHIERAAPAHAPAPLEYHNPLLPDPPTAPALPASPTSHAHANWDEMPQRTRDQALLKGLAPEPGSMRAPGFWRRAALPLVGASALGGVAGYGLQHGLDVGAGMPDWTLPVMGAAAAPALGAGAWALHGLLKHGTAQTKESSTRYDREIQRGTITPEDIYDRLPTGVPHTQVGLEPSPSGFGAVATETPMPLREALLHPGLVDHDQLERRQRLNERVYRNTVAHPDAGWVARNAHNTPTAPPTIYHAPYASTVAGYDALVNRVNIGDLAPAMIRNKQTQIYGADMGRATLDRVTGGLSERVLPHLPAPQGLASGRAALVADDAPQDRTLRRAFLNHELGESADFQAGGIGTRRQPAPHASHLGVSPLVQERLSALGDPHAHDVLDWLRSRDDGDAAAQRAYRRVGGTPYAPVPAGGRQHRALEAAVAGEFDSFDTLFKLQARQRALHHGIDGPVGVRRPSLQEALAEIPNHLRQGAPVSEALRAGVDPYLQAYGKTYEPVTDYLQTASKVIKGHIGKALPWLRPR